MGSKPNEPLIGHLAASSVAAMLALSVLAALSFSLSPGPRVLSSRAATIRMRTAYEQQFCEEEYNPATKQAEEVCYVPPTQAALEDLEDGCILLGEQGTAERWACSERLGANAEEEFVSLPIGPNAISVGAVKWVHYVH